LTASDADNAGFDTVNAVTETDCPAEIVDAGEYNPEAEIGPVEPVPPATPLTDHRTAPNSLLSGVLYCAEAPSLTRVGPSRGICRPVPG
jgi:hypothetical protein